MSPTKVPRAWLARVVERIAVMARGAIPRRSALGDRLRRVRHRLARPEPSRPIEAVIHAFGRAHPRARFVQVGSNDGVSFDPICAQVRTRAWTGIMIEPVPHLYERLRLHFGDNRRIALENSAISGERGRQPFYFLAEDLDARRAGLLPDWYEALGSFRRDVLLSHRDVIPDIEDRVQVIEVPCLTFDAVCEKHGLADVDLVHIDTEGYDYEVLKLVDLGRWQPAVLLYEHLHLSEEDRAASVALLEGHGYQLLSDLMDTLCVHESALQASPPLAAAWTAARAAPSVV